MLFIFDIDGTLIRSFLREGGSRDEFDLVEPLPGRLETLAALANSSEVTSFALATNQGGVAFGYQTPEQVYRKLGVICSAFHGFFGVPVSFHACFTHPDGKLPEYTRVDARRKPGPGMLIEACEAHDVARAVFVGDMDTDREAARAATAPGRTVLYRDAKEFFGW